MKKYDFKIPRLVQYELDQLRLEEKVIEKIKNLFFDAYEYNLPNDEHYVVNPSEDNKNSNAYKEGWNDAMSEVEDAITYK